MNRPKPGTPAFDRAFDRAIRKQLARIDWIDPESAWRVTPDPSSLPSCRSYYVRSLARRNRWHRINFIFGMTSVPDERFIVAASGEVASAKFLLDGVKLQASSAADALKRAKEAHATCRRRVRAAKSRLVFAQRRAKTRGTS